MCIQTSGTLVMGLHVGRMLHLHNGYIDQMVFSISCLSDFRNGATHQSARVLRDKAGESNVNIHILPKAPRVRWHTPMDTYVISPHERVLEWVIVSVVAAQVSMQ